MNDDSDQSHATHSVVRSIARNTGFQMVGEAASKLASLALYVVVARSGGPARFGVLVFCLSLSSLTTVVASFGVEGLVVRDVARDRGVAARMLRDAISIKVGFGAIGIGAALLVTTLTQSGSGIQFAIVVFAASAVIDLIAKSYYSIFQAFDDMRPIAGCILAQRILTASVGIVVTIMGGRIVALSLAFIAGSLLAVLGAARALARLGVRPAGRPSFSGARALARQSFALGLSQAFNTILFRVDATMLSIIKGDAALGLYGVAYRLLESTLFITYDFSAALAPTLARLGRDTQPTIARAYEVGCRVLALLLVPIGDAMIFFPHPIVHLIYGHGYGAADGVMRLLGVGSVTYGFAYLASYLLITQQRDPVLTKVHAVVALQNIILNLILIPGMSYLGAALSTTISETTRAVWLMRVAWKVTGAIRLGRILFAPVVASGATAVLLLLAGPTFLGLIAGMLAYVLAVIVIERLAFPEDAGFLVASVLRRGPDVSALQ